MREYGKEVYFNGHTSAFHRWTALHASVIDCESKRVNVYVSVQFYPWFNFDFPLFDIHYHVVAGKAQWKIKIEPRIKLNYNIYKRNSLLYSY